jgi:hypothetical protein
MSFSATSSAVLIKPYTTRASAPEVRVKNSLLSSRMSFSLAGKHRVGPFVLLLRQGHSSGDGSRRTSPIRRGGLDAPDIPWLFQRKSDQPVATPAAEWHAVCDAGHRTRSRRKFVKQNRQSRFQRLAEPHTASLSVDHQSMTVVAEWNSRIQAGKPKRDLRPNSGTTTLRFERFGTRAHRPTLLRLYVRHESSFAAANAEWKPK